MFAPVYAETGMYVTSLGANSPFLKNAESWDLMLS
jgi:hypothetical protein